LAEGDFEADLTALVVGASLTDGFTARAEGGDGNGDGDFESEIFAMESGIEAGLIVDESAWRRSCKARRMAGMLST